MQNIWLIFKKMFCSKNEKVVEKAMTNNSKEVKSEKKSVLLATGLENLNKEISKEIKNIKIVDVCDIKESVLDKIQENNPTVIILGESLKGDMNYRELILKLCTGFPKTRIIYLLNEKNNKEKLFLYHWHVFDVWEDDFGIPELEKSIHHPKEFKDICQEMSDITPDERKNGVWYDVPQQIKFITLKEE